MRLAFILIAAIGGLTLSDLSAAQDRRPAKPAQSAPRAARPAPGPATAEDTSEENATPPADQASGAEEATAEDEAAPEAPEHEAAPEDAADDQTEREATPDEEGEPTSSSPEGQATQQARPAFVGSQCSAAKVRHASRELGRALAHVEAPGGRGLGFVFYSRRHVLTPASLIDTGRGIRVRFDDHGHAIPATVVALDEVHDLALLELESPAPTKPLRTSATAARTGDPVMALSFSTDFEARDQKQGRKYLRARRHHLSFRSDTLVQTGTVTFSSADRLRTNAFGGHGHWGAPIVDCDGNLVGVSTSPIADASVALGPVESLSMEVADETIYRGRWSLFHPHAALVGQVTHTPSAGYGKRDKWLGFSAGTALIGHDRWYLPARFTATFLVGPDLDEPFADRRGFRVQGSTGLGYRIMLTGGSVPFYLAPVIGGTVMYERITTEQTELWVEAPCPNGGCQATPRVLTQELEQLRVMPTFGGGLQIGPAELSYQFILDTELTERSVHQLTLGAQF